MFPIPKHVSIFLVFVSPGLALIGAAIFANALGFEQEAGWGKWRIALLLAGGFILACGVIYVVLAGRSATARDNWIALDGYMVVFPFAAIVLLIYVWLISSGTWTTWVSPTRYYANLARGFGRGNLYLPSKPPAELVDLPDPYDYKARNHAGIAPPIDVSYYNGKYYLYWGPVPSLLLVMISPFHSGRVGDLHLVFAFACGIFLTQSLLLIMIWNRFYRNLPVWMLAISIMLVGLGSPVTFMLDNLSGARIYEAAIFGAQFFLVGGFLIAYTSLSNISYRTLKLLLAGIFFALAIGTRQTVFLSVGVVMLAHTLVLLMSKITTFQKIKYFAVLMLPVVFGVVCLGWYNWSRFGSITETGLYYQMNYGFVHYHSNELVGVRYILQNLYNYLLMPFRINSHFPFLTAELGSTREIFPVYSSSPSIYHSQVITGLLCTAPFVIFSVVPLFAFLFIKKRVDSENYVLNWTVASLGVASLASFCFLLLFFWSAMRYIEDFMPFLMVLSMVGFWQGYSLLLQKPYVRNAYATFACILAAMTITISTALAVSINDARFVLIHFFTFLQ